MFLSGLDQLSAPTQIEAIGDETNLDRSSFKLELAPQSGCFFFTSLFRRHQILLKLSPKFRERLLLLNLEFVMLALDLFALNLLFVMLGFLAFFQCRDLFESIIAIFL